MLDAPKLRTAIALWADDLGLDLSNLDGDMLIDRIRSALVATPPAERVVACKECDGTGFKDKNGARLTIARTACGACAGSGYVAALAAKDGRHE